LVLLTLFATSRHNPTIFRNDLSQQPFATESTTVQDDISCVRWSKHDHHSGHHFGHTDLLVSGLGEEGEGQASPLFTSFRLTDTFAKSTNSGQAEAWPAP